MLLRCKHPLKKGEVVRTLTSRQELIPVIIVTSDVIPVIIVMSDVIPVIIVMSDVHFQFPVRRTEKMLARTFFLSLV